ncbi:MAG: diaminopimelate decarboxylase [Kiritimatiellia bacterium]|jgi:diaminopimelate decarboxylase
MTRAKQILPNPDVLYFPAADIGRAAKRYPTPFFIYEERRLRDNCARFRNAFLRYFPTFHPLFAIKANANPELLKIIFSEGYGADASSEAEAWITHRLGARGMYTGNYTTPAEFRFVIKTGVFMLNLDDISMLPDVKAIGMPEFISFRVNPGITRGGMRSLVLAGPDAKYGVPTDQIVDAYRQARTLGAKRFGLHAMTGSNVLEEDYFAAVADRLLDLSAQVKRRTGILIERINIGGGFGVPYRPEQRTLNLDKVARSIRKVFDRRCGSSFPEPILMAEPGRLITADTGWLVGRINVIKQGWKKFLGIDAGMNDLPRPAIYDAYHHISVLHNGPRPSRKMETVNVVGRLCENNDQFARDRRLPRAAIGDLIVIHNAGAHAYAMGHNYNNRLRSAEYLITRRGALRRIRRAETIADLFRTTRV